MNYTVQQIAEITNAEVIGDKTLVVKNIAYDSRIIYSIKNTAFIAINTHKNSGEKFIEAAIDRESILSFPSITIRSLKI